MDMDYNWDILLENLLGYIGELIGICFGMDGYVDIIWCL